MVGFFFWTLLTIFVVVSLFMILLILIQKGRGGGLAASFGGGGGGNTAFGSKTGDVLTWTTSIVFGVFLLVAVALNLLANKRQTDQDAAINAPPTVNAAPGAPAAPPPAGP